MLKKCSTWIIILSIVIIILIMLLIFKSNCKAEEGYFSIHKGLNKSRKIRNKLLKINKDRLNTQCIIDDKNELIRIKAEYDSLNTEFTKYMEQFQPNHPIYTTDEYIEIKKNMLEIEGKLSELSKLSECDKNFCENNIAQNSDFDIKTGNCVCTSGYVNYEGVCKTYTELMDIFYNTEFKELDETSTKYIKDNSTYTDEYKGIINIVCKNVSDQEAIDLSNVIINFENTVYAKFINKYNIPLAEVQNSIYYTMIEILKININNFLLAVQCESVLKPYLDKFKELNDFTNIKTYTPTLL